MSAVRVTIAVARSDAEGSDELISGSVVELNGCLAIESDGLSIQVIWPASTSVGDDGTVILPDSTALRIGDTVSLSGGQTTYIPEGEGDGCWATEPPLCCLVG